MRLLCDSCRRDLNEIWQDNMSTEPFVVLCEDCSGYTDRHRNMKQTSGLEGGDG